MQKKNSFSERIKPLFRNRWFRWTLQGLILTMSTIYLVSNFRNTKELLVGIQLNFQMLTLATILTIIAVYLGALGWTLTLRGVGQQIPWDSSIDTHLTSNLAKYMPGFAWQLIGKAYLTRQSGVPSVAIGTAMVLELAQLVIIGFGIALLLFPANLMSHLADTFLPISLLKIFRVLGLFLVVLSPVILVIILQKTRLKAKFEFLKPKSFASSTMAILSGWLIFGLSFWMIGFAVSPLPARYISEFIFVLVASILIGLAIIIIPGSFGVRESIMVYLLTNLGIVSSVAVVIAILSRLILTLSELISLGIYRLFALMRQPNKDVSQRANK